MIRKVAVIMGSDSDWPVVKGACAQLKALDIPFEAHILSAHRTPASVSSLRARISAASQAAFLAPFRATVATGMPLGIWTVASSASRPSIAAKEEKLQNELKEF